MSSANKEKNGLRKLRERFFGPLGLRALYVILIIQSWNITARYIISLSHHDPGVIL